MAPSPSPGAQLLWVACSDVCRLKIVSMISAPVVRTGVQLAPMFAALQTARNSRRTLAASRAAPGLVGNVAVLGAVRRPQIAGIASPPSAGQRAGSWT